MCLDLTFSDSRGITKTFHKALAFVQAVTENGSVVRYDVRSTAEAKSRFGVFSETYFQLPF